MTSTLKLYNDIQEVPRLSGFIEALAESCGMDPSMTMSLNLAVEEAVVNVMNYAYPKGVRGEVVLDATVGDGEITIVLSDSGTPFDPLAVAAPDLSLAADERPVGGLGIFLVRQLMDSVSYSYADGKNILTMKKKIKQITS